MLPQFRMVIGVAVVLLIIVAAIFWTTRSNAPVPDYQNRVAIPGIESHVVTLWPEPSSPSVGTTELTAQIGDPSGMPIGATEVGFRVFQSGGIPETEIDGTYVSDAPTQDFLGNGHGYRATASFDEPGEWIVEVRFVLGDVERTTQFEIEVDD